MTIPSAGQIIERLEVIDADLTEIRRLVETHAQGFHQAKRDWELELAKAYVASEGSNQKERESQALISLAKGQVYKDFIVAEAGYRGAQAALSILETRASVGQSVLRVLAKEAGLQ